ncbi:hypothetical protein [Epibacterium ulvae]|uniref:hypothetical protein n=1 Tax=Epibacterium ulvae TaxID=1156985 RepID=UPI00248FA035|nr:hypothetical protein [Epibacterium ulvae]
MSVNWLQSTTEQRKALYKVAKSVATTTPLTLERFLNKALGITGDPEWGDLANIRNGKLAREKCQTLYDYLAKHHYEHAQTQDAELFPRRLISDVGAYIEANAHKGRLRIVLQDQALELVKRKANRPDGVVHIRPEQGFFFELNAVQSGYALAYQFYQGTYHPLPLGVDGETLMGRVIEGPQYLPKAYDGEVSILSEDEDLGDHQFIILTASNQKHLRTVDGLPFDLELLKIYSVRVFVGLHHEP